MSVSRRIFVQAGLAAAFMLGGGCAAPPPAADSSSTVATPPAASAATASLESTYWKLVRLRNAPVEVADRQREPHLILQPAQRRVVGSGGCNRMMGGYTVDGERLTFTHLAGTLMACPQGMAQERAFLDTLAAVKGWRVIGERLELLDAGGESLAAFDAVDLR